MNAPLDDVAMEQYIAWLDDLERTDPEGYKQIIDTMQQQMQTAGMGEKAVASAEQGDKDVKLYHMLKTFAGERNTAVDTNLRDVKLRCGGDTIMGEDGLVATQEGVYIDVKPGFVMMTSDTKNKKKIFVNVVHANEIQVFSKKKKLDDKGTEKEGIHVPLSLSALREVQDKMGVSSLVVDMAVNTKVVEDCKADRTGVFRNFVCELAIEYIDQKYKMKLDERYKLPRLAYRGPLPPPRHYVYKTQTPIIQEVTTETLGDGKRTRMSKATAQNISKTATARFDIFEERNGDRTVCRRLPSVMESSIPLSPAVLELAGDRLIVDIAFENNVRAAGDVELELHAELLNVKIATCNPLEIFLPYPVDINSAKVCFNQDCNTMDVIFTIDKSWDALGPDCGSASWLLEQAVDKQKDSQVARLATSSYSDTEKPKTLVKMFELANTKTSNGSSGLLPQGPHQWGPAIENKELSEDQFYRKNKVMSTHVLEQQQSEHQQRAKEPKAKDIQRCAQVEEMLKTAPETDKPCREMYPDESETTCLDVEHIVRQVKLRLDHHQQQQKGEAIDPVECIQTKNAKRMAAKWSENNRYDDIDLQSALAFGVL